MTVAELKYKRGQNLLIAQLDNKKNGEKFLAENKTKEGVVELPSGLQYKILKAGDGRKPADADTVECRYRGIHIDGTEFDNSELSGQPTTLKKVSEVLPGWREALKLMSVGSKWQLFIPSQLAYGQRPAGRIGPYETIIYEIELVDIK
jgi:FKBP-type peptidyl-prolyl cis-trans isomerase FklB